MKIVIAFCMFCTAGLLFGVESIAIVKNVNGSAHVKREGSYLNLVKGADLQIGDILQTADQSSVGFTFNDGTVMSVGPKSMMVLTKYLFQPSSNGYEFDVTLKKGTAAYESGKLGTLAPKNVVFKIPQGSVGIRGTKFIVDVEE